MNAFVHYRHLPSMQPFSKVTKRFDWLQKQKKVTLMTERRRK